MSLTLKDIPKMNTTMDGAATVQSLFLQVVKDGGRVVYTVCMWLLDIHFDVLIYNPKLATTSYFGKAEILRTFSNLLEVQFHEGHTVSELC